MRMLLHTKFPPEPFNAAVRDGSIGAKIKQVLGEMKAQAVCFTEYEGRRGAILIVDVAGPADVPRLAEPWFLMFGAQVEFHVAMTPEELAQAGLDKLGQKWS